MTRWWIKVALLAGWVAAATPAWAQFYPVAGPGPGPEPMPVAPPAMPGGPGMPPIGPGVPMYGQGMPGMPPGAGMMPPGAGMMPPGAGMMPPGGGMMPAGPGGPGCGSNCEIPSLDANTPGAFTEGPHGWNQAKFYLEGCGIYAGIGALGLQRARPGHGPLIITDPQNLDTGNPPPAGSPTELDMHSITPLMRAGIQGEIGYFWDWGCIEVNGFYMPQTTASVVSTRPGQLDLGFFNPPLGFEGDNGLWLQADRAITSLRTEMGSAEINLHLWKPCWTGFNGFVGVRYLDVKDLFEVDTDDDSLSFGVVDPTRQALYQARTHNRIVAPQLGLEYNLPVAPWMALSAKGKGAWGANFVEADFNLQRGDGFVGFSDRRDATIFSQIYEVGAYMDLYAFSRFHLRAGYQCLWVLDVQDATGQFDFDLSHTTGTRYDHGSMFFHGPTVEFQILF